MAKKSIEPSYASTSDIAVLIIFIFVFCLVKIFSNNELNKNISQEYKTGDKNAS